MALPEVAAKSQAQAKYETRGVQPGCQAACRDRQDATFIRPGHQGQSALKACRQRDTLALEVRRNLGPTTLRALFATKSHFQDKCAPLLTVFPGW